MFTPLWIFKDHKDSDEFGDIIQTEGCGKKNAWLRGCLLRYDFKDHEDSDEFGDVMEKQKCGGKNEWMKKYTAGEFIRGIKDLKTPAALEKNPWVIFLTQRSRPPGHWHGRKWVKLGYELKKAFNPACNPVEGEWPNATTIFLKPNLTVTRS